MARDTAKGRKTARPGLGMLAGLLLLPASAVAAVAIVGTAPAETAEPDLVETVAIETTTSTEGVEVERTSNLVVDPVTASQDDVLAACTVDGLILVEAEAAEEITSLQAAALDALRQICEQEGMPLPGKPAPPPVVRTVKVVKNSGSGSGGSGGSGGGGAVVDDGVGEPEDDDDHEEQDDDDREHESSSQAAWVEARDDAAAAISAARQRDPNSELLDEAEAKLAEAKRKAAEGEWSDAVEKAREAKRKAQRVGSGDDD